jgi:hypothetical protein
LKEAWQKKAGSISEMADNLLEEFLLGGESAWREGFHPFKAQEPDWPKPHPHKKKSPSFSRAAVGPDGLIRIDELPFTRLSLSCQFRRTKQRAHTKYK